MTTAIVPEGESVPGQAPTELSPVESPSIGLGAPAVFILQNTRSVKITYFTVTGTIPVGVALLFAAIGGAEGDSAVRWVPPAASRSVREASIRSKLRLHTFNTEGSVRTACAAHYTPGDARHLPEWL